MVLYVGNGGAGQTVWMRKLTWALNALKLSKMQIILSLTDMRTRQGD